MVVMPFNSLPRRSPLLRAWSEIDGSNRITDIGKSRGPSDRQKNGNTASKVPLNSLNNDSMDFPLPALSMPRPEIPPGGSPDAHAMSQRRVRCAI